MLIVLGVLLGGYVVVKVLPGVLPLLTSEKLDPQSLPGGATTTESGPLTLPEGFTISIFAENLPGARDIAKDPAGNIIVSLTSEGRVVALPDNDGDRKADEVKTVISGLNRPHGLLTHCREDDLGLERICYLYIAETDAVVRYKYDALRFEAFEPEQLFELPSGTGHFTRSLEMLGGEQPLLLTAIGSSCNVCIEDDPWRGAIIASTPDGENIRTYARGLRNAVFLTVREETGELWATENSRDLLGDDIPPDEVNRISEGVHYGWPFCYGNQVSDPEIRSDSRILCSQTLSPTISIQAHSAPLGLSFIPSTGWPAEYQRNLLVAFHGSWNRTVPTGYKVVRYVLNADGSVRSESPFIEGWYTKEGKVLGRPVDIFSDEDSIYISDDRAGVVYNVRYGP